MTIKYSLLTHLTRESVASCTSGIKSRISGSLVEMSIVTTLYRGAFRLVLRYIKDPWFVILSYHSSQKRDCEAGKDSHVIISRIFINDFSPGNIRLDSILIELTNPHEIYLGVSRLVNSEQQNLEPCLRGIFVYIYVDIFSVL